MIWEQLQNSLDERKLRVSLGGVGPALQARRWPCPALPFPAAIGGGWKDGWAQEQRLRATPAGPAFIHPQAQGLPLPLGVTQLAEPG